MLTLCSVPINMRVDITISVYSVTCQGLSLRATVKFEQGTRWCISPFVPVEPRVWVQASVFSVGKHAGLYMYVKKAD